MQRYFFMWRVIVGISVLAMALQAADLPAANLSITGWGCQDCARWLTISGPASTNFVLQSSTNLSTWSSTHQAYGHPGTNGIHFFYTVELAPRITYWRALPGEDLSVQAARWHARQPSEYQFFFRRMISFWEGGVRGTVRVLNGVVVSVENAVDDRSGQPIATPDLKQFFSIDQIFDEIRRAYEAGYEQIKVVFDSNESYPARVSLDWGVLVADDDSFIEARDLVVLSE
jgi:hypothetical protein